MASTPRTTTELADTSRQSLFKSLRFDTARAYLAGLARLPWDQLHNENCGCFGSWTRPARRPWFKKLVAAEGDGSATPRVDDSASTDSTTSTDNGSSVVVLVASVSPSSSSGSGSTLSARSQPRMSKRVAEEGLRLPLRGRSLEVRPGLGLKVEQLEECRKSEARVSFEQDFEVPGPVALGLLAAASLAREGQYIYRWRDGRRILERASYSQ